MDKREDRRDRTFRYAERAYRIYLRINPEGEGWHSAGYWKKGKALGCRCRKHVRAGSPKLAGSLCHSGQGCYHPGVAERISGRRLIRGWRAALQSGMPAEDVEL